MRAELGARRSCPSTGVRTKLRAPLWSSGTQLRKRVALARCGAVRLTFPPFDKPAEDFTIAERQWAAFAASDRLAYALVGQATDMTSMCVVTRTRLPGRTGMITAARSYDAK
jgi:hypothetical protein